MKITGTKFFYKKDYETKEFREKVNLGDEISINYKNVVCYGHVTVLTTKGVGVTAGMGDHPDWFVYWEEVLAVSKEV